MGTTDFLSRSSLESAEIGKEKNLTVTIGYIFDKIRRLKNLYLRSVNKALNTSKLFLKRTRTPQLVVFGTEHAVETDKRGNTKGGAPNSSPRQIKLHTRFKD